MTQDSSTPSPALDVDALQELDDLLETLRARGAEEIPQWEFCDGFLSAIACTRRTIETTEWLPMLLGDGESPEGLLEVFETAEQQARFVELALARLAEIRHQLDDDSVKTLEDEHAFAPEVMDTRGAVLTLPAEEQAALEGEAIPSLAQVWALGFMFVVENWNEEWASPRDKDAAQMLDEALACIVDLTEDDTGTPVHNLYEEDGPASTSQKRLDAFGQAIWAVYDLRRLWRSLGPRVETLYKGAQPGRNDPCSCGSGKKYKKCCGA